MKYTGQAANEIIADAGGELFHTRRGVGNGAQTNDLMRSAQEVADATGREQIVHSHSYYGACLAGLWAEGDEAIPEHACRIVRPRSERHQRLRDGKVVKA